MTLALALLAGGALAASAPAMDLAEMRSRGSLRVLVAADEYPAWFSFVPGTEPGLERELIEGFARLHRMKLEPVPVTRFEDVIPMLQRGEGDVILGINDTEARRKLIDFTHEVLPSRHVVVNRKPRRPVETVDAFRAERVGLQPGTSWEQSALEAGLPPARIERLPDFAAVLDSLRSGKITATVMSLSDFTLAVRKDADLQAGVFLGPPGSAAWGVRKSDGELKAALDAYVDSVRKTATWSRLVVKYFGEESLRVLGRAREQGPATR
jgi:ABC-type amino acid transport substrate-binding protein